MVFHLWYPHFRYRFRYLASVLNFINSGYENTNLDVSMMDLAYAQYDKDIKRIYLVLHLFFYVSFN